MSTNHEIVCPHCQKVFSVDESEYANLLNQVSKEEITREVHEKLAAVKREQSKELELAEARVREQAQRELADKNTKIAELSAAIEKSNTEKELAITKAVIGVEKERDDLARQLETKNTEQKLRETSLRDKYESELRDKDEMIAHYKDMKVRLSTKMVGESLEQHCEVQFNQLRPTAFRNAYFEKDNQVSRTSGSKGDFIFRDFDENGNEFISIMFEMKNENETTATKHKNEDFLKELDKDRNEKKCEYAVLVSMLEADSELYNTGIVDMSHKYEKMYVIRPQFFIPMITLLRNAALNSLQYRAELAEAREQNIDITDFEERIEKWKSSFGINSERATKNFNKAIKEIEESIKRLENTRDALVQTVKNFETANRKLDDLTVKRLTRGNPTMTEKFAMLESNRE